jgi:hypothetical protein
VNHSGYIKLSYLALCPEPVRVKNNVPELLLVA